MAVRNALPDPLALQPRHGYELRAAFEAMMGGPENWDLRAAQMWSTLERLEVAGLVRRMDICEGRPERSEKALIPARQAAKMNVVEALRYE